MARAGRFARAPFRIRCAHGDSRAAAGGSRRGFLGHDPSSMSRPLAVVSVDVDPVDLHLTGYGFKNLPPDALAYTTSLPRLAEVFAQTGVKSTLFIIAKDARSEERRVGQE